MIVNKKKFLKNCFVDVVVGPSVCQNLMKDMEYEGFNFAAGHIWHLRYVERLEGLFARHRVFFLASVWAVYVSIPKYKRYEIE